MIGKKFSRLTVSEQIDNKKSNHKIWKCLCDCGSVKNIREDHLTTGTIKSCGCLQAETRIKHGMYNTPTYKTWAGMIQRCTNKTKDVYKYYGGRGIEICKEWLEFSMFYKDMGERPKGLTLERTNNNEGYNPNNCRWATRTEQARNTRKNRWIEYNGERLTVPVWAERLGVSRSTINYRVFKMKWPLERALTKAIALGML